MLRNRRRTATFLQNLTAAEEDLHLTPAERINSAKLRLEGLVFSGMTFIFMNAFLKLIEDTLSSHLTVGTRYTLMFLTATASGIVWEIANRGSVANKSLKLQLLGSGGMITLKNLFQNPELSENDAIMFAGLSAIVLGFSMRCVFHLLDRRTDLQARNNRPLAV